MADCNSEPAATAVAAAAFADSTISFTPILEHFTVANATTAALATEPIDCVTELCAIVVATLDAMVGNCISVLKCLILVTNPVI